MKSGSLGVGRISPARDHPESESDGEGCVLEYWGRFRRMAMGGAVPVPVPVAVPVVGTQGDRVVRVDCGGIAVVVGCATEDSVRSVEFGLSGMDDGQQATRGRTMARQWCSVLLFHILRAALVGR